MILAIISIVLIFFVLTGSATALSIIDPKVEKLGQAISQAEGFGVVGAFPTRNNNPGDLIDPATGEKRVYGTVTEGWQALFHQLELVQLGISKYLSRTQTWYDFAVTWTGNDNARFWAEKVSSVLGVDPNSTVDEYFNG